MEIHARSRLPQRTPPVSYILLYRHLPSSWSLGCQRLMRWPPTGDAHCHASDRRSSHLQPSVRSAADMTMTPEGYRWSHRKNFLTVARGRWRASKRVHSSTAQSELAELMADLAISKEHYHYQLPQVPSCSSEMYRSSLDLWWKVHLEYWRRRSKKPGHLNLERLENLPRLYKEVLATIS